MNETILMIMLVAIMIFFFIFGMVGYEKNKKRLASEMSETAENQSENSGEH